MWALFMIRNVKKQRPVNLDLQTIRFPITAIASILHRVSGVITFIAVGILLWLLGTSLSSPEGFQQAADIMDGFIEKKLYPNVDFYSGIILKAMGIPSSMFTVIFAMARTVGWIAHWNEMHTDGMKIARPRQLYTGYDKRDFKSALKR